ncbi:LicD family protein [Clostridium hydrogeniformans]|uniref:LicD family protein n=1 Tax=Clostridium hydrogeniformans TaxID=349933 RepID=UPI0006903A6E|nr:LicD family protein [Clostridium hydrogeniformans]
MEKKRICTLEEAQQVMLDILKDVDRVCKKHNIKYFLIDGTLLGAIRHKGFIPWDDDLDIGMMREDYEKFLKIAEKELKEDLYIQNVEKDKQYTLYHIPTKVRKNGTVFLEFGEENPKYHSGIYIDVFPYDKVCSNKIKEFIRQDIVSFIMKCKYEIKGKGIKALIRKTLNVLSRPISHENLYEFSMGTVKWTNNWNGDKINYGGELMWNKEFNYKDIFPLKPIEFQGEVFQGPNNPHNILENIYGDYMTLPKEEDRTWHAKDIYIVEREDERGRI